MKTKAWVWLVASMLAGGLVLEAAAQDEEPATYCRFVKERKDDFAWENDKIAFRAYGPALRGAPEDSGVEVWLKCVDYPIIDAWYKRSADGYSFQQDHGEGYVPFTAGASRGCGGLALWVDGKMVPSNVFKSNRIEKKTKDESVFVLNYEWRHGGATYTEEKLGSPLNQGFPLRGSLMGNMGSSILGQNQDAQRQNEEKNFRHQSTSSFPVFHSVAPLNIC